MSLFSNTTGKWLQIKVKISHSFQVVPVDIDGEGVTSENGEALFAFLDEFQHILKLRLVHCFQGKTIKQLINVP